MAYVLERIWLLDYKVMTVGLNLLVKYAKGLYVKWIQDFQYWHFLSISTII